MDVDVEEVYTHSETAASQNEDEGAHLYGSRIPSRIQLEKKKGRSPGSTNEHSCPVGLEVADAEQELETLEKEREQRSPSPLAFISNRTGVDGMDAVYANVLRRVPLAPILQCWKSSTPVNSRSHSRMWAQGDAIQRCD